MFFPLLRSVVLFASGLAVIGSDVDADALPDPTRPLTFTAASVANSTEPSVRLEAILRSGDKHLAIVNGKLVRAGDRIDNVTIASIDADGLRYVVAGREHVAKLAADSLKVRRNPAVTP